MTNRERIQTSSILALAEFLHRMQVIVALGEPVDSVDTLVEWLAKEEDIEGDDMTNGQ